MKSNKTAILGALALYAFLAVPGLGAQAAAVVVVDLQAEALGAARQGLADATHADNPEPLAVQPLAEHPGR